MSELSETIGRLEQWAEHWEDHQPESLIADLRALLNTAKATQRAAEVLQKAQRHELDDWGEMQTCSFGDWLLFDDVSQAIKILEGECEP